MPAISISAKAAARKACIRRSARSARSAISALALARGLGQQVSVDAGADEVADRVDGVTLAVEGVAPQIGIGGDVGVFRQQAFADGSDEGGGLFLLPGGERRRRYGRLTAARLADLLKGVEAAIVIRRGRQARQRGAGADLVREERSPQWLALR
jgi:hypothetical protein